MDEKDKQLMMLGAENSIYKGLLETALRAIASRSDANPHAVLELTETMRVKYATSIQKGVGVDFVGEHIDRIFDDLQKRYSPDH